MSMTNSAEANGKRRILPFASVCTNRLWAFG